MNTKVHELLNQQINKEFYSAYLYLDFSNYFEDAGLDGFANWYKIQAQEERDHAMLFYQYLQNENQKVTLEAIDKPDNAFSCHMDVLKAGLDHEKYVTSLIHNIYAEAYEAKDFRTMQFLDWFVKEQGEEETNANDLISKMELFGSDPKSLYMLNQEPHPIHLLGSTTLVPHPRQRFASVCTCSDVNVERKSLNVSVARPCLVPGICLFE